MTTAVSADGARTRIVRVAYTHIARHGVEGAKIRDIAREADVSTALIHYHFAAKSALLAASLTYAWERAESSRIRTRIASRDTSAAERLADLIAFSLPTRQDSWDEWLLWTELWLQTARDPRNRRIMDGLYGRIRGEYTTLINEGISSGEFTGPDVDGTVELIVALIDGYGIQAMMHRTPVASRHARSSVAAAIAPMLGISTLPFRGAGGRRQS